MSEEITEPQIAPEEVIESVYTPPQTYTFVLYDKQNTKSYGQFDADNLKPIILSIDPSCDVDAFITQVKSSPLEEKIDTAAFVLAKTVLGASIFYDNATGI
jgi:hypothetical protein